MKKRSYLSLYNKWIRTGHLNGYWGLCKEFRTYLYEHDINTYKPDEHDEYFFIMYNPKKSQVNKHWGGEKSVFTPLRQNIVLFMAAMNDEL